MTVPLSKPADLTERQWELFRAIWDQTCRDGYQPSIRSLADQFRMSSTNGVVCHLRALARKGYLDIGHNQSRAIRFLKTPAGSEFRGFTAL